MAKFGGKALSAELKKLAKEAITITNDGTPVTREQKLAEMIWRQALGWTEDVRDENGDLKHKDHPPVSWAQQFLYERIEGKSAIATPEEGGGMKALDKVRSLNRDRLNKLASTEKPKGPPIHKPATDA